MLTWLHISDTHFCKSQTKADVDRIMRRFLEDLSRVITNNGRAIDLVFFTGDAAYGNLGTAQDPMSEQYAQFTSFLDVLSKAIFGGEVRPERFIIVPGNHDVDRQELLGLPEWRATLTGEMLLATESSSTLMRQSLRGLHEFQAHMCANPIWGPSCPSLNSLVDSKLLTVDGISVGVTMLNTAWLSYDDHDDGQLRIGRGQLLLGESIETADVRLCVAHHPITWLHQLEEHEARECLYNQHDFLLHGHEHIGGYDEAGAFVSIRAGALYTFKGDKDRELSYNLVQVGPEGSIAYFREWTNRGGGAWKPLVIPGKTNDMGVAQLNFRMKDKSVQRSREATAPIILALPVRPPAALPANDRGPAAAEDDGLASRRVANRYDGLRARDAITPSAVIDRLIAVLARLRDAQPNAESQLAYILLDAFIEGVSEDILKLFDLRTTEHFQPHRVETFVSLFYGRIHDTYIGIDSHLPSKFAEVHPFLLSHLTQNLPYEPVALDDLHCHGRWTARIIARTKADLARDFENERPSWRRQLAIHHRYGIRLYQVDPQVARRVMDRTIDANHRWTTDVGLWPRTCALLFEPADSPDARMRMGLVTLEDPSRLREYGDYVKEVLGEAQEIDTSSTTKLTYLAETAPDVRLVKESLIWCLSVMFEPALAKRWHEFVNPPERIRRSSEFLDALLEETPGKGPGGRKRVFDAAMGTGVESVYLAERDDVDVTSNEIEWVLIDHAVAHAGSVTPPVELNITNFDWRHVDRHFPAESFDMVFVLGNSLTCLLDRQVMVECLEQFHNILAPGGRIVVDERNYRAMADSGNGADGNGGKVRDAFVRIWDRLGFLKGHVVYTSQDIKAKPLDPVHLSEEGAASTFRLEYTDQYTKERVGTFEVYAFGAGEVASLLAEAGFEAASIRMYSDFQAGDDAGAEFYTYVAQKNST